MEITKYTDPSWFGFPILCKSKKIRNQLGLHLEKNGIETRPIICGNMVKQPGIKNIKHRVAGKLLGADKIMNLGIFWESSPDMTKSEVNYVTKIVKNFFN